MTRTKAREIAVQLIYAVSVGDVDPNGLMDEFFSRDYFETLEGEDGELYASRPNAKQREYVRALVNGVFEHIMELDGYIEKYSRGWRTERISKTAMACLRCALCEIEYMDDIPPSAAINEAVELAKGYDEPETVAFINGILGSFMRGEKGVDLPADAEMTGDEEPDTDDIEAIEGAEDDDIRVEIFEETDEPEPDDPDIEVEITAEGEGE